MKYVKTVALLACIILSNVCFAQDKNAPNDSKEESKNKHLKLTQEMMLKLFRVELFQLMGMVLQIPRAKEYSTYGLSLPLLYLKIIINIINQIESKSTKIQMTIQLNLLRLIPGHFSQMYLNFVQQGQNMKLVQLLKIQRVYHQKIRLYQKL